MCQTCRSLNYNRRGLLGASLACLAAVSLGGAIPARAAGGPTTHLNADQALAALKEGNANYIKAPDVCAANLGNKRTQTAHGQAPFATIISCSDSRVPPELVFGGLGLGELFVIRNAGNTVDTVAMGSIEYAIEHLSTPLVVVLGHERCGAVTAACEIVEKKTRFPGSIQPMAAVIVPAAQAVRGKPGDFIDNTVRESAHRTASSLAARSRIVREHAKTGKLRVIAARYDLDTGEVSYL